MKSTIIAAATTALAFATPAMAQEADSTGLYGAIHAGLNMPSKQPVTITDVFEVADDDPEAADQVGVEVDMKNAIEIGGTLGYDFGMIRADVDVSYSRAKTKSLTLKTVAGKKAPADALEEGFGGTLNTDFYEIPEEANVKGNTVSIDGLLKLRRFSVMGNVWIDIPVGSGIEPYVGGGAGLQGLSLSGEGKTTFAWQFGAGVAVPVNRTVSLSADYRYRQQKGFTLRGGQEAGDEGNDLIIGKIKSSSIFVSLRVKFGAGHMGGNCSGPC